MKKLMKAVVSVTPGPILAWVGKWVQIFQGTYIIRDNAPQALTASAIAMGTVVTIILAHLFFGDQARALKGRAKCGVYIAIFCVALIFMFRFLLDASMSYKEARILFTLYDITSFVFLNSIIITVFLSILYLFNFNAETGSAPTNTKSQ